MNRKQVILTIVLFFYVSIPLFGKTDGKLLIYYFQNLGGDESMNDLMYQIPLCLYSRFEGKFDDKEYTIIDEGGLQAYYEDNSIDLWEKNYLLTIVRNRRISKVLYGFYYEERGKIVTRGKIYYLKNGLILDITEEQKELYLVLKGLEKISIDELRNCGAGEPPKSLKTPKQAIGNIKGSRSFSAMTTYLGVLVPAFDWGDLYSPCIYGDVSYIQYPRKDIIPLGFGAQTGFIILRRDSDPNYVASETMIIPLGASIQYAVPGRGIIDRVIADFTAGIAISSLSVNNDTFKSIDIYTKGSMSFNFLFKKNCNISVMIGLLSITYKDSPLNAFTGEVGMRFYEF